MDILKRIGAIVLVLVLIGMYVATFIMGITGSDNLMGMIFLDVVIPVVLGNMAHRQGAQTQGRRYERSEQVEQYKYVEKNYII